MEDIKQYKTLAEWKKDNPSEYTKASNQGWLEELYKLAKWPVSGRVKFGTKKPDGYWTKERCIKIAKKYNTYTEWIEACSSSVNTARKHVWYEECTKHMKKKNNWSTKEKVIEVARKYDSENKWRKGCSGSYRAAGREDWMGECISHMKPKQRPRNHWNNKETCIEEARKHLSITDWKEVSHAAYDSARKNGWLVECREHMIPRCKPKGYWTKENCIEEALKHTSKSKWAKAANSSCQVAHRNKWVDECTKHMK